MRSLFLALSGFTLAAALSSSGYDCTCTGYKYAIKTTTYVFNQIEYSPTYVSSYTATQKKKTSTTTTTTTIINTSIYTQTVVNTATITARIRSTTTKSVCLSFTTPADYSPYSNYCQCPHSTTTLDTIHEKHTRTKTSTYYTGTVTLYGTKSPIKTVTQTVLASSESYLYIYTLSTTTTTATAYKKTKTVEVQPFATPTAFKLQVSGAGEDFGVGNYSGYMSELKWSYTYDYGNEETYRYECLSWMGNGSDTNPGIFHFINSTAISLGSSGTCTSSYSYYNVDCSDNTWVQATGEALQCFIDCLGLLQCYYDRIYTAWTAENYYGCARLGLLAYQGNQGLDVRVIPV